MNSNAAGVALGSFTVPAFGYELGAAFGHAVRNAGKEEEEEDKTGTWEAGLDHNRAR